MATPIRNAIVAGPLRAFPTGAVSGRLIADEHGRARLVAPVRGRTELKLSCL